MKYALVIADTEGANLREPLSDKVSNFYISKIAFR